jgi:hypothetical protein
VNSAYKVTLPSLFKSIIAYISSVIYGSNLPYLDYTIELIIIALYISSEIGCLPFCLRILGVLQEWLDHLCWYQGFRIPFEVFLWLHQTLSAFQFKLLQCWCCWISPWIIGLDHSSMHEKLPNHPLIRLGNL